MKSLILISNEKQFENLKKKYFNNFDVLVTDRYLKEIYSKQFPDNKIFFYEDVLETYKSWDECLKEEKLILEKINGICINEKRIFKEIIGYKGYSFLDIDALRYLSGHFDLIANLIYKKSIIKSILGEIKPNTVFMFYPFTDWEEIMGYECENNDKIDVKVNNFQKIYCLKDKYDFIELIKILNLIPLVLKIKSLFLISKNYISKKPKPKEFKILIFSINTKNSDIVLPLSESLKNDNINPLIILPSDTDYVKLLQHIKVEYNFIESYLDINNFLKVNSVYKNIISNFNKIKKDLKYLFHVEEICKDIFIRNKIIDEIENSIYFSYSSLINIFLIQKIVKNHSAQLLLCTHFSENIVNSLFVGCKESGIPTIGLHRETSEWHPEHSIFHGDKLLVSGVQSKKIFSALGVDPKKIVITGFPIFDNLLKKINNKEKIESQLRKKLEIKDKKYIITYLTQSFGARFRSNERINEINMVLNTISKFENIFLIIKLHPTEYDTDIYDILVDKLNLKNIYIIKDSSILDEILLSSKVALTKNSTTGFNALIAGCELVTLNSDQNNFFLEANVAKNANNSQELFDIIKNSISRNKENKMDPMVEKFVSNHFCNLDCNSIGRIKENIYNMFKY